MVGAVKDGVVAYRDTCVRSSTFGYRAWRFPVSSSLTMTVMALQTVSGDHVNGHLPSGLLSVATYLREKFREQNTQENGFAPVSSEFVNHNHRGHAACYSRRVW